MSRLETWPDVATEVFMVPSQVKWTSLVPPNVVPPPSIMVKLLSMVSTQPVVEACRQSPFRDHTSQACTGRRRCNLSVHAPTRS